MIINKKVFKEFLGEIKEVERQKKKYEKAARIQRAERQPFPYWDEVFILLAMAMFVLCVVAFMAAVKVTFF